MSAIAQAATVVQAFEATARAHADKPAVRANHRGLEWSWDDLRQRVRGCAAGWSSWAAAAATRSRAG